MTTRRLLSHLVYIPVSFFFFNDTATTEIYTLSLHDALPISADLVPSVADRVWRPAIADNSGARIADRKSTRLNSSHLVISYAVFCLKKKKLRDAQDDLAEVTVGVIAAAAD